MFIDQKSSKSNRKANLYTNTMAYNYMYNSPLKDCSIDSEVLTAHDTCTCALTTMLHIQLNITDYAHVLKAY